MTTETLTTEELHDFVRAIRREAHILRSGAGGNRVALQVCHRLIDLTGGEGAAAFDEQVTREKILATAERDRLAHDDAPYDPADD